MRRRLTPFVRFAPILFYGLAGIDFLKNLIPLMMYWLEGYSRVIDPNDSVRIQIFAHLLSSVIYAATWIVYGVVTAILIGIFDRLAIDHGPDVEQADD